MFEARFIDKTGDAIRLFRAAAEEAVAAMGENIYEKSQQEVPVNTGQLKDSGRVKHEPKNLKSTITYGSPRVRYAASVHSRPGVRYRRGKWQYLRDPLMRKRELLGVVSRIFRRRLGKGS